MHVYIRRAPGAPDYFTPEGMVRGAITHPQLFGITKFHVAVSSETPLLAGDLIDQMAGKLAPASVATQIDSAATLNTVEIPNRTDNGPTIASESGSGPMRASQKYDPTRDIISLGIVC